MTPGSRQPTISVVICTHNPRADYFTRCLAGLRAQTLGFEAWELLIIDNASRHDRAPQLELVSWHGGARVVVERKVGLTPARLTGIREAHGELLVFVDDDNVLDPDFLEQAARISRDYPFLGAWSGQCRPGFEAPPPEWTRRYWGNLVIREFDTDHWSNLPRLAETMPCGAGLCIRRGPARHYLELNETGKRSFQLDRTGTSLLSGGDNDMAACACDVGLGVGLISALKLTHLIPQERLTANYLTRLAEGIAFSSIVIDGLRGKPPTKRNRLGKIADIARVYLRPQPHRSILKAAYRGRDKALAEISAYLND